MTSRKTTSADTAQCSTTSHDAATDALAMSQSDVAVLAETFRLLGDQSRLKILLQCMHGSVAVGDIAEALDLSQSLVSHHLRLLRGARLVRGERQAKHIFYSRGQSRRLTRPKHPGEWQVARRRYPRRRLASRTSQ